MRDLRESAEAARFLRSVRGGLWFDPRLARRAVLELEEHLREAVESEIAQGVGEDEAIRSAVARLGSPQALVAQLREDSAMMRGLLSLAAAGSALIGCWLAFVLTTVLPHHNDDQIPFWTVVMLGFFAWSALTVYYMRRGRRRRLVRWIVSLGSVAAMAAGVYAAWTQVDRAGRGLDFEGYIVLMGAALAAHGFVLAADLVLSRHSALSGSSVSML
jgi:hypothetical protein